MSAPTPSGLLSEQPEICRLLVAHYADRHSLKPDDLLSRLIVAFAAKDSPQPVSEAPLAVQAQSILQHYARRFGHSPGRVLTGIIQQFVLGDVDFSLPAFRRFVSAHWGVVLTGRPTLTDLEQLSMQHAESALRPRCPVTGAIDTMHPDEAPDQDAIDRWFTDKVTRYRCPAVLGAPERAQRGIHSRELGTLRGTLTIMAAASPPLPDGAQRPGIFGAADQQYPVILRYSTSGGPRFESMPDNDPAQAVGLALKILTESGETAHDLLFINSPTFMTNNPSTLVFAEDASSLRDSYAATRPERVTQALDETQYSVAAFSWGRGVAIKYALMPLQTAREHLPSRFHVPYDGIVRKGSETCLTDALGLVAVHADRALSFALCIQLADPAHEPSHGCPTDDERVEWKTPWHSIAEVRIEPQEPQDGGALSFTPFHVSDASLLPLGRLNRSRQRAYAVSRQTRHQLNTVSRMAHPHRVPQSLRIAVVGGGASGLASALALARCGFAVTVLERAPRLGGHACVKDVDGGRHRREPAFGAFREHQWPNLWALLGELGVTPQSHGKALDWFDSPFAGWFAADDHPISRSTETLEASQRVVLAFAKALREPSADGQTIGALFDELGVSSEYLMTAFVGGIIHYFAGHSLEHYLQYPTRLLAWMWLNNAARADEEAIELFRVDNEDYMRRFAAHLEAMGVQIRTGVSVQLSGRDSDGVRLQIDGEEASFAEAVLAIQPQHALSVLGDHATPEEHAVLGGFQHTTGTVIVHQDRRWMPKDPEQWKLFNVMLPNADAPPLDRSVTLPITINKACVRDGKTPIFATYDYNGADEWQGPGDRFTFEHLKVTPETQRLREQLSGLQGRQRVHFCGSWSRGLTLHEDAIVTGLEAANRILGPDRAHPILEPPVPLPQPFKDWVDPTSAMLGGTRAQILGQLQELLAELQPHQALEALTEDAPIQELVTSSLHLARLANSLSARMPAESALDITTLLHIETVGELLDLISDSLRETAAPLGVASTGRQRLSPEDWVGPAYPVTLAQQSILESHFRSGQSSSQWNIALGRWLVGPLKAHHVQATLEQLAERHTALRTRFEPAAGNTYQQRIVKELPASFFHEIPAADDAEAQALARAILDTPLDVTRGVLRARLIRTGPERVLLVLSVHHAVSDGWSIGLLLRSFWSALPALRAGQPVAALQGPPPAQQIDAAGWEAQDIAQEQYSEAVVYWEQQLARPLPTWPPARHLDQKPHMASVAFSPVVLDGLKALARQWKTSLNVVLIASYAKVVGQAAGQDDLLVRLPTAGRAMETEAIVGCFADAMLLRVPLLQESLQETAARVHTLLYEAMAHSAPFSLLRSALRLSQRELIHVNQVVLNLEQGVTFLDIPTQLGSDLRTEPTAEELRPRLDHALFRSLLSLNEHPDGQLRGEWFWSTDLADRSHGQNVLVGALQQLITAALGDEAVPAPAPSPPQASGCPFHDVRRRMPQDARDIETLTGWYDEARDRPPPPQQDVHIGTLDGQLTVPEDSAPQDGIFAAAAPRPVRIRLSTRFGAGGLALKVHDGNQTLHDLLLLTARTMVGDPLQLVQAAAENTELGLEDVLFQPYFSISAYGWGAGQAVRFRVQPRHGQSPATLLPPATFSEYTALDGPNARTARLRLLLQHTLKDIDLELSIQRASDPTLTPVNDTLVEWMTPFEIVATLSLPAQTLSTVHEADLRFHPFHVSDAAFLPLGHLNRVRREIYDHTTKDSPVRALPYQPPRSMRVAVVGAGASGLQAALALADFGYQVTVFEAAAAPGGHACAKDVDGGQHRREPAFGAFRAAQWPNLMVLLKTLQVEPRSHGRSDTWVDSPFVGWWRPGHEPVRPSPAVEEEARRFIGALHRVLADPESDGITVGELIASLDLSAAFVSTWFIGSVVHYFAGHTLQYYMDYPARLMAWMWLNNAARADGEHIELLRVDNDEYITAFTDLLRRKGVQIQTETAVTVTSRAPGDITLSTRQGDASSVDQRFGKLILAIQPHQALKVLGTHAVEDEQHILSGFSHTVDVVRIDADHPLTHRPDHRLLNVMLPAAGDPDPDPGDTLPMVIIKPCARDQKTPIAATYCYAQTAADAEKPDHFAFEHAKVTPNTQRLRQQLPDLQGQDGVYFCGSWSRGLTLHEDALVSALEVVNLLVSPGRGVEIALPPVPLPEPFAPLQRDEDAAGFGESTEAIVEDLREVLTTVLEGRVPPSLNADTSLHDIQLSSLHFARLANAVSNRLPADKQSEVDIVLLLQMETLGELAEYLRFSLHPDTDVPQPPPQPQAPAQPSRREHVSTLPEASEQPLATSVVLLVQLAAIFCVALTAAACGWAGLEVFSLGQPLGPAALLVTAPLAYATVVGMYSAAAVVVKHGVVGTLRPGRYPLYGPTHLRWWVGDLFLRIGQQTVWAPIAESRLPRLLLKLLGGRVDTTASVAVGGARTTVSLIDADLLDIQAGALARPGARIRAHMFLDGCLVLAPVTLGQGSMVWTRALVEPGASVGAGALLEPHAVLAMGQQIPEVETWTGVPARSAETPTPLPLQVSALEHHAHLLSGMVLVPWAVAATVVAWWAVMEALLPGLSLPSPGVAAWLLAYPAWVLVTGLGSLSVVAAKWLLLGRLEPGSAEEDHPVALPMIRAMTGLIQLAATLWPSRLRWTVASVLGARLSPQTVTEEPFLDLAYADLFSRSSGSFFSPAAFLEFARPEEGQRRLHPIELVETSYVGAYSTVTAPVKTQPQSLLAGCSALPTGTSPSAAEAWVGAPARPVPLRPGDAAQGAFSIDPRDLRRVKRLADAQRVIMFVVMSGIIWQAARIAATGSVGAALAAEAFFLGAIWAVFLPPLWLAGRTIRKQVRSSEVLERDGVDRKSRLFAVWGSTILTMAPVALTTDFLAGTPIRTLLLRLLGARVGRGVYLDQGVAMSELPFLDIGDGAVVNEGAALIGHSEQPDGRVSFKTLHIGKGSSVLWSGYLVGGTRLPENAVLGSLSRPFDGQRLSPGNEYNNTPCQAQDEA